MTDIKTLEQLFEFMAEKIGAAQGAMPEAERMRLINDAVYEAAMFTLAATPSTGHHQLALAAELLKRLRNFHSPYFIIAREMGDEENLRKLFEQFITTTDGWESSRH